MTLSEMFDNRIGRFSISLIALQSISKQDIAKLFTGLMIISCKYFETEHRYEYCAYSDLFDKDDHSTIPEYRILAVKTETGELEFKFYKIR